MSLSFVHGLVVAQLGHASGLRSHEKNTEIKNKEKCISCYI